MPLTIRRLSALEILDSRGNPTIQVEATLSDGTSASAQVPSGASTGSREALELRDGDPKRYRGRGVRKAVQQVETVLHPLLEGHEATDHGGVDRRMRTLASSSPNTPIGANAILGISCAVARAAARSLGIPLWRYLARERQAKLPVPMVNILSGGLHAHRNLEFQDFLAYPLGFPSYNEALHAVVAIHGAVYEILTDRGIVVTGMADEGGWGPRVDSNEAALEILIQAIEQAGFLPGKNVWIALDVAASHFFGTAGYRLATEATPLTSERMIDLLDRWSRRYPIVSIEDGLDESDWSGWKQLTARLGSRLQVIGDDLLTTNPATVRKAIEERAANAVLVKMNQVGTLTETFEVIDLAREAGWGAVVSARSGETEDSFLADLAVASGCGQIKVGSITRSERLAKYNRLLEIEAREHLPYALH
jgi:enolase